MEDPQMNFLGCNRIGNKVIVLLTALSLLFSIAGTAFGAGGGITILPDISLVVQIVNFIFLIWILNILLYKPIRNVLLQRKDKVAGLEQRIETGNNDTKEKDDAFASGIKEARAKGLKEKEILLAAAVDDERKIIENINKKTQADLLEIREKIAEEAEVVRESLRQELDAFAAAIGQKILGRPVL